MNPFLWIGAGLTVAGLAGLAWCIRKAAWLRRADIADEQATAELRRLVPANVAAVGVAFIGLAVLVVGLILA
ncbi:MAG TPA: hypothetical protein VMM55_07780 [Thermohalobaculum sp.]|nr:hypothetical protein [Thermohalobaculum sp.]